MSTPDTTADAIKVMCDDAFDDAIGGDFRSLQSLLAQIVAHAERMEADRGNDDVDDDIGVIPPIRTDEMVMVPRAMYARQMEELETCTQRGERLRAYSEDLAGWFTSTEKQAREHLMPGDLGDEAGDG